MLELNLHGLDTSKLLLKKILETLTLSQNMVISSNMSAAVFFINWFAIKQLKTQALYIANVEIKKN